LDLVAERNKGKFKLIHGLSPFYVRDSFPSFTGAGEDWIRHARQKIDCYTYDLVCVWGRGRNLPFPIIQQLTASCYRTSRDYLVDYYWSVCLSLCVLSGCYGGTEWTKCGGCERTCSNPMPACHKICNVGCRCPDNTPIWHQGHCITLDQCWV